MKKSLTHFILFILSGVLLSSCGNTSKLSITKRHYRSGFYVHFGSKRHINSVVTVARTPVRTTHQIQSIADTKSENNVALNFPVPVSQNQSIIKKVIIWRNRQENYSANIASYSATQEIYRFNDDAMDNITSASGNDSHDRNVSVPFVVVVLCAIFIPPLGVGLIYGIDSYFWIDLILTLLFFFPGMIFALIVVLM